MPDEEIIQNALNPGLYGHLRDVFKSVKVSNEGEQFNGKFRVGLDGRVRGYVTDGGEEYRVCCPICGDKRHRLYINHMWGTSEKKWDHLIHCFNEDCDVSDFATRRLKRYVSNRPTLRPGDVRRTEEPIVRTDWPGECVPLVNLPSNHPALEYLRWRKFDPLQIADLWDVRFCVKCPESPRFHRHLVEGRIIIPVYWERELIGWQARAIDNSEPKYYTMPGLKKRRILYNGDRAKHYQTGVLVEGVTDAWRIGPRAVALLGKSVSSFQRDLMCAYFHGGTLIIMLDPDAVEDIERVHKQLHPDQFKGTCKVVRLPVDTDPGELTTEFLYEQIRTQARVEVVNEQHK